MNCLKSVRRSTTKLRKVLHNGFFVNYPVEPKTLLEGQVKLWRAVIDIHLKDIISHHLIEKNFNQYYDAIRFFHEQQSSKGQEYALALLDPVKVVAVFNKFEKLCRDLREKGIKLE